MAAGKPSIRWDYMLGDVNKPLILDTGTKMAREDEEFNIEDIEKYLVNINHSCSKDNYGLSNKIMIRLIKYATVLLADNKLTVEYVKRVEKLNNVLMGKFDGNI